MDKKELIRKNFLKKRIKDYFQIDKNFFLPLIRFFKSKNKNKKLIISLYYPSNYEVNILNILDIEYFKKFWFLLPVIEANNFINFCRWKKNDILKVNKFGILEPVKSKIIIPDIVLVPLLAFDNSRNRLGYGKGYYDKYISKLMKMKKKTIFIGIGFSFQKFRKIPINKNDMKLDYILTEKGMI